MIDIHTHEGFDNYKIGDLLMQSSRKLTQVLGALLFAVACVFSVHAQTTTGTVRGVVTDQNGAIVPGAKVTLTKKATGTSSTTQTSDAGTFEFSNLQVGEDYIVKVEAANFKASELTDVRVSLNQATDLPVSLSPGAVSETVTVTAGGTELVDTTTTNLSIALRRLPLDQPAVLRASTISRCLLRV
jgi:hypothetical protein